MSATKNNECQAVFVEHWAETQPNRDNEIWIAKLFICQLQPIVMRGALEFTICGVPTMIHFDLSKGRFWTIFAFTGEEIEV